DADIIVLCTNHPGLLVNPHLLKPGTVVCDAAKPFNMPRNYKRRDIVVIEGGQIELPHPVEFTIDFDCGPNRVSACMAEPMLLAISGRVENFCLGNKISLEKIEEIGDISKQCGFNVVSPSESS
ncbi:MAG TPA: shikimate dehydrogenase, partial [Thermodesulfovibrionia bacterium]|nr:shikimate dehydrogenase [Thermodesulfovibrionia bacterium]